MREGFLAKVIAKTLVGVILFGDMWGGVYITSNYKPTLESVNYIDTNQNGIWDENDTAFERYSNEKIVERKLTNEELQNLEYLNQLNKVKINSRTKIV